MTAVQPFLVHKRHHVHEPRNFVATAQCYGGTFQQFSVRLMEERDIECRWVLDPANIDEWASKIDQNTRFLYGELPSNPQLGFFDIKAVADLAHSHSLPLICDSTVATPALLRPILAAMTGLPRSAAAAAAAMKVSGSRTPSMKSMITAVSESRARWSKKSPVARSASLPVLTT